MGPRLRIWQSPHLRLHSAHRRKPGERRVGDVQLQNRRTLAWRTIRPCRCQGGVDRGICRRRARRRNMKRLGPQGGKGRPRGPLRRPRTWPGDLLVLWQTWLWEMRGTWGRHIIDIVRIHVHGAKRRARPRSQHAFDPQTTGGGDFTRRSVVRAASMSNVYVAPFWRLGVQHVCVSVGMLCGRWYSGSRRWKRCDSGSTQEGRQVHRVILLVRRGRRHPVIGIAFVWVFASPIGASVLDGPPISSSRIQSAVDGSGSCCSSESGARSRACMRVGRIQGFLFLD